MIALMDISELRKRLGRAIDDAKKEAASRRVIVDEARTAYAGFLENIAVPMLRQTAAILKANGQVYEVHTPSDTARLVAEKSPHTFVEIELDLSGDHPDVLGRLSLARGRQGQIVEERPIARDRDVSKLTEEDFAAFLVKEVPKLIVKS